LRGTSIVQNEHRDVLALHPVLGIGRSWRVSTSHVLVSQK